MSSRGVVQIPGVRWPPPEPTLLPSGIPQSGEGPIPEQARSGSAPLRALAQAVLFALAAAAAFNSRRRIHRLMNSTKTEKTIAAYT